MKKKEFFFKDLCTFIIFFFLSINVPTAAPDPCLLLFNGRALRRGLASLLCIVDSRISFVIARKLKFCFARFITDEFSTAKFGGHINSTVKNTLGGTWLSSFRKVNSVSASKLSSSDFFVYSLFASETMEYANFTLVLLKAVGKKYYINIHMLLFNLCTVYDNTLI